MNNLSMPRQVATHGMTPSAVEVLLYYHMSGGNPHPRHDAPAVIEARVAFLRLGAIVPVFVKRDHIEVVDTYPGCRTFITTEYGARWVKAICATPRPES